MYATTSEYKTNIMADKRKTYGKVQISYTDVFLDQSIEVTASETANISYPEQTADNIVAPIGKILSLDGSCAVDGSYVFAPLDILTQMGFWGEQLAGINGTFIEPYPTLTASFISRPVHSLKVIGDSARNEFPVDFTVKLYDAINTLLYTETVTGNNAVTWTKQLATSINSVTKQVLHITKWSHTGRQVKILEFFTSIQEIYEGDDILEINLLEERETESASLPIGNISANEIDIKLNNVTRKFDAGNTQSPLYETLKANRRIKAWIGVDVIAGREFVPLGVFWSGDWEAPENNLYAKTTGRDRLEFLRTSTYSNTTVQANKTLYDLAIDVLTDAELTSEEYFIDTSLQSFIIPYAYFDNVKHREALRQIAEASLSQIYCDRNGIIRVEGYGYTQLQTEPALTLTQDNYINKNNPLKWSQIANYIEVDTKPLQPDTLQEVYKSEEINILAGETKTITAFYNMTPCIDAAASITAGNITDAQYYSWGATIKIYSDTASIFVLSINAKPLTTINKNRAIAQDADSIIDNGKITFSFPENNLIQTIETAQTIADNLLASFKNPRRDVEIEWRGHPALLLGDKIAVIDNNETNNYFVTKQEMNFNDGILTAKLNGRRV